MRVSVCVPARVCLCVRACARCMCVIIPLAVQERKLNAELASQLQRAELKSEARARSRMHVSAGASTRMQACGWGTREYTRARGHSLRHTHTRVHTH
jgi:hypothetical protein